MAIFEKQKLSDILETADFRTISEHNKIDSDDVFKILQKACSSFRYSLSQDELSTCCINALWKAIDRYSVESTCKFTTYLYKGVVMECLSQKKYHFVNICVLLTDWIAWNCITQNVGLRFSRGVLILR